MPRRPGCRRLGTRAPACGTGRTGARDPLSTRPARCHRTRRPRARCPGGARSVNRAGDRLQPAAHASRRRRPGGGARSPARSLRHRAPARGGDDHQRLWVTPCHAFYGPHPENHLPGHSRAPDRQFASRCSVGRGRRSRAGPRVPRHHGAGHTRSTSAKSYRQSIRRWVRANFDPVNLLGDFGSVWANARGDAPHVGYAGRLLRTVGTYQGRSRPIRSWWCTSPKRRQVRGMLDFDAFFEVVRHQGENTAVIVEHLPAERALAAIAYVKRAAEERGFTFGR